MHCEILMIGTELLIGQIQDTNATRMGQMLAGHGINLYQKTTVSDNPARIVQALRQALARAPVVLCSGGLGPTEDDITRECVAEVFGEPLEFRPDLYESVLARFSHLKHLITDNNKKQATLPRPAVALENPNGTAPGFLIEGPPGTVIGMPGVPFELDPMMRDHVLPYLCRRFGIQGMLRLRVLKISGVAESRIDAEIGDLIAGSNNPTVGLLASPDVVRIRIAARADSAVAADALIAPVEAEIRRRIGGWILGADDDTLESVVDGLLAARGWRLYVGETVTGGMIAQRLSAAGAVQFAGAQVRGAAPAGVDPAEWALDWASENLLAYSVESSLAMAATQDGKRAIVAYATPLGGRTWEIPLLGQGSRGQTRAAVQAMDGIRRHLTTLADGA